MFCSLVFTTDNRIIKIMIDKFYRWIKVAELVSSDCVYLFSIFLSFFLSFFCLLSVVASPYRSDPHLASDALSYNLLGDWSTKILGYRDTVFLWHTGAADIDCSGADWWKESWKTRKNRQVSLFTEVNHIL